MEPHPRARWVGVGIPEDSRVGAEAGRKSSGQLPKGLQAFLAGQFLRPAGGCSKARCHPLTASSCIQALSLTSCVTLGSYLTSVCLSFLSVMGTVKVPTTSGDCRKEMNSHDKCLISKGLVLPQCPARGKCFVNVSRFLPFVVIRMICITPHGPDPLLW